MIIRPWLVICALLFSGACYADMTGGEVLQQGGKKMTAEELQQLHAGGVKYNGKRLNSLDFTELHNADGTVLGAAQSTRSRMEIKGTWKISDTGQLCVALIYATTGRGASQNQTNVDSCESILKQGDKYYAVANDSPGSPASVREFVK